MGDEKTPHRHRMIAFMSLGALVAGGVAVCLLPLSEARSSRVRARSVRMHLEEHLREGRIAEASILLASDSFRLDSAYRRDIGLRIARARTGDPDLGWTPPHDSAGWTARMASHLGTLLDMDKPLYPNAMDRIRSEVDTCLRSHPRLRGCLQVGVVSSLRMHDWRKLDSLSETLLRLAPQDLWGQGGKGAIYLASLDPDQALLWLPHFRFGTTIDNEAFATDVALATHLRAFWNPIHEAAWFSSGRGLRIPLRSREKGEALYWKFQSLVGKAHMASEGWRLLGNKDSFAAYQSLGEQIRRRMDDLRKEGHLADHFPLREKGFPIEEEDQARRDCRPIPELMHILDACSPLESMRDTTRASMRAALERLGPAFR